MPRRLSLAYRLRGWKDDASALEQRLKDLDTFARSYTRRWVLCAGVFALGLGGALAGDVATRWGTIVLVPGAAAIANLLVGMVHERGWYRWWLIYLLALFGLFYALRSREPVYLLLLVHIAYFVAIHSALNVQYRFISPLMPYMILLAGLTVYAWRTRVPASIRDYPLLSRAVTTQDGHSPAIRRRGLDEV